MKYVCSSQERNAVSNNDINNDCDYDDGVIPLSS